MSLSDTAIINTIPAANSLRMVSGFNPLSYLRRVVSAKTGQPVLRLDLTHKKLWFRLACPNGRMVLNPLRITDQLAIFEAQVFLSKDDKEPFSRFTSSVSLSEAGKLNYVKAAQEQALNEALESAGFGIQLCDIAEVEGSSEYGSEVPAEVMEQSAVAPSAPSASVSPSIAGNITPMPAAPTPPVEQTAQAVQAETVLQAATAVQTAPVTQTAAVTQTTPVAQAAPVEQAAPTVAPETVQTAQATPAAPVAVAQEQPEQAAVSVPGVQSVQTTLESAAMVQEDVGAVSVGESPEMPGTESPAQQVVTAAANTAVTAAPAQEPSSLEQLLANTQPRIVTFPAQAKPAENAAEPQSVEPAPVIPENTAEAPAGYTPDMSVEDIMARMTLDEALAVVVTTGTCKGWTLGQVAQSRAPSLKFYVCSGSSDNVLKAASKIVLEDMALKKAG